MRHLSRYSALARGLYTPEGRKGAGWWLLTSGPHRLPRLLISFSRSLLARILRLPTSCAVWSKISAWKGLEETSLVGGVPLSRWRELAELMKQSRYGVIMFGIGVTQSRGKDLNLEEINTLVSELNRLPALRHSHAGTRQCERQQPSAGLADRLSLGCKFLPGISPVQPWRIQRCGHAHAPGGRCRPDHSH